MIGTEQQDSEWAICPFCGKKHGDCWEWITSEDDIKTACSSCGKEFIAYAEFDVTYHTRQPEPGNVMMEFDFAKFMEDQRKFSEKTFGPGLLTKRITSHIRKELKEIEETPEDLEEWCDVILMALDGAWRTGATSRQISEMLLRKQRDNIEREWPDWREVPQDEPIEHIRRVNFRDAAESAVDFLRKNPTLLKEVGDMLDKSQAEDVIENYEDNEDNPIEHTLTEAGLKEMMRDPKYWRDQDPEIVKKVQDGFYRLFPE